MPALPTLSRARPVVGTRPTRPCRHGALPGAFRQVRASPGAATAARLATEENDGRGKDRPVLVVAREAAGTFLAVQLSSRRHDGDREWVAIGSGPWDRTGRDSWVAVDRILRLHEDGMRREACALDRMRFNLVRQRLHERYGWT
ncbi:MULTISPECIES: type II toxin-antitoxin system PemK/MazF family toxin [unclassified Streptomyces]|uniref:type II toxin-antitoxin system PemK/MazF family toxin n=1 Tax=unclassified Streptomyces TaxID=2593676 RepID=UPI0036E3E8D6